ncbi:uncharacterized protein LOC131050106 isoform X2 [Cryptomeria japonica]|uniref:uncharacterized protein LOC131050106 isoform X2 n=1 Tax=Cryptomeria japonica TaxID=3369 RepID=UPI0025AB8382|nr:uncharacterized protein LOC131050106 isoform X2 [Cryptomeria japonica]
MFGKTFKPAKCKTALRLAISRIKLLKNKKELQLKQTRRDLAQLLQSGQEPSARIQVEHLIREQNIIGAYDFIEIFCELIVARLPMIESQKNCPIDLQEAISTLIFTAPRCADIPELSEIRSHFGSKYGKEFVASAAELRPECGVNRIVIEKLSARAPNGEQKLKVMKEIAKEHQIKWDPTESEKDLLKPPEDLLNGPSKFVGATKFPTEHKKEATNSRASSMNNISKSSNTLGTPPIEDSQSEKRNRVDSPVSRGNVEKKPIQAPGSENNMKATNLHQETLEKRHFDSLSSGKRNTLIPRNTLGDEYDSSQQSASYKVDQSNAAVDSSNVSSETEDSNNKDWNMKFKDAASAAEAAAYSAERASEAAKAAAELSKHNTVQKQYSRKNRSTSSSDEEMMELNNLRTSSRPGSNESVQPENQTLHGNDLSGKHHVESDYEILKSHNSATWQSNQQKETGKIDDGYELPMKSIRRLESYQWPSDEITGEDTVHGAKKSAYVRREERQYIGIKEEKAYSEKDSDFGNSVDGSGPWKRDPITLQSNTQPSEDFNVSFNRKSKSVEEFESKRAEDRRNAVTKFPLFDDSPQNLQSDNKWSQQKNEDAPAVKASCMDEAHSNLYQSYSAFQPPIWSPPDVFQSSDSHMQYSLSNNIRPVDKVSTQPGNASYDSSGSDDDMSNSMMRGKSGSNGLIESAKWPFNDHDHSGGYLVETNEKNGKSQRKAHQQNELANAGHEYLPMKRTVRTDIYHQPSNRIDRDKPFADKSQPLRREQEDQVNSSRPSRNQTDIRKSVEESLSRKGKKVDSRTNTRASDIVGDIDGMESDNEYDMPMKRTVSTDLYRQPSNRIHDDGNKTYAVKYQPLRKKQEKQGNTGGAIRKQTDNHKLIDEPPSKKGNTVYSRSNLQASEILSDSDRTASESDEETELETYNENSGSIRRSPLSGNSSGNASSNTKHVNPKLTGNFSTPTPSSVNETHADLAQSDLQFQPLKQSFSGPTTSSQTSFQSPSSAGESKAQKENLSRRAAHVHPKLPDYDDLAAKFAAMKRQ